MPMKVTVLPGLRVEVTEFLLMTLAICSSFHGISNAALRTRANITTTSTLLDGEYACSNSTVTFTCETRGSSAIGWRSEEFIGVGSTAQLIFIASIDHVGATRNGIVSTTVATLTKNELENGTQLLESTFRVLVPASSNMPLSVTCVHLDGGVNTTTNFMILPLPDEVQNADVVQVPCVNSTACVAVVSWYPPSNSQSANVTHYVLRLFVYGYEFFTRDINATPNETALSAYYVIPICTAVELQNVVVSGFAVNQCGEGPRQDAVLLDPVDDIGEVICVIESASAVIQSSTWVVNGAMVLAFVKAGF